MRVQGPLIVGGGPAGCAAAISLARGGSPALVLERTAEPADALCGGFLSWNTAGHLAALGIDVPGLGAKPIRNVRLFARGRSAQAVLPSTGWSLSRLALDHALMCRAGALGVAIERGVRVTELAPGRVILGDGGEIDARVIVEATGKHELRGRARTRLNQDPALGLRWRLAASPSLARFLGDSVELHLFAKGYAGLVLQEDGTANLCMAVRRSVLAGCGGDPALLLARLATDNGALAERLDAAGDAPGRAQAVANVPYGWIAGGDRRDTYRVGDQAAVIASLAGEGIAIALASGRAAGEAILAGTAPDAFQREMRRRARFPVRTAGLIMHLAHSPLGARCLVDAVRAAPALADIAGRASRIRWSARGWC